MPPRRSRRIKHRRGASISADQTVRLPTGAAAPAALAEYHVKAAASRITAECERLLQEASGATQQAWRVAIGRALLAARHLAAIVDHAQPLQGSALHAAIGEPQREIIDAMSALLALIPTSVVEGLIMQDARGVRDIAIGLLADKGSAVSPRATATPADGASVARILVVDDDEALRRTLSRLLTRLGYAVTIAANGREALQIAERDLPDLVITDLTMPEMSGHELLARLKSTEATQHVPVIVVSGEGDNESVVRCLEQGAEDHLTKPYETVVLQARVRTTLERKRLRDAELAYLKRVAQLTAAAEAVERQAYESRMLEDVAGQSDPLGHLARVLDRMINGIRTREAQLEGRVRQLRAEMNQIAAAAREPAAPSGDSHFALGAVLADRYEIVGELGKGGMGMVYLAKDRELGEEVALKLVRRDLIGQDPTLLERLKSEIRLARKISHTNVVRSHDLGEWQGVYFITMEYVRGTTVEELIRSRGRLAVDSTLAIGTQLAEALVVAHAAGIIHRDIKPQNLLIDQAGTLKVTDFGLARPLQRSVGFTSPGFMVGTPSYMAPEQMMGGDVDARADLFASGVVLYECLTGRLPFLAESPMGIVAEMMEGQAPPVRTFQPSAPAALERLIERLLEPRPEDRPTSARELAEQLAQVS